MSEFERQALSNGARLIAGVDEAGRGPLAGPIVASAVMLGEPVEGVDDSKKLSEGQRETLFDVIMDGPHVVGVAVISSETIDAHGIQSANYGAMSGSLAKLDPQPDFALVDGFNIKGCAIPQMKIVKGDQRSQSIAAASIIAKVTRDRIMLEMDERYPGYGFARHKGYGTRQHLEAIDRLGPCPIHRKSFAPIAKATVTLELFQEKDMSA